VLERVDWGGEKKKRRNLYNGCTTLRGFKVNVRTEKQKDRRSGETRVEPLEGWQARIKMKKGV